MPLTTIGGFLLSRGFDTGTIARSQGKSSMQFNYRATARFMFRHFVRVAWTTTQQKWTTASVIAGLVLATMVMPGLGIAVFGTAFAGWWLAVFVMTIFFGLIGNRVGVGREKATLMRQAQVDARQD
jgi:hypothetical protein